MGFSLQYTWKNRLDLFVKPHLQKSSQCTSSPHKAPANDHPYLHQVKPRAHLPSRPVQRHPPPRPHGQS